MPLFFDNRPTPEQGEDQLLRFNDVPKLRWLPQRRGGSPLSIATVHRWATTGIHGQRLRFVSVGGVRCTTEQWLRDFFNELASGSQRVLPECDGTEVSQRRRAEAACRQLQKEGF